MRSAPVATRAVLAALLSMACTAGPALAQSVSDLLAAGDQQYAEAHLTEARAEYAKALELAPDRFETLCRLVRAESELGELQKGDEQRRTWASAVEHARTAIKSAPDSGAGHVWLAVALGRQALREGPKTKLALSREIKSEVDRALQLDPSIGRAWHVRAVWNMKISSLNLIERMAANTVLGGVPRGASFENADRDFQKAIQLEPNYVNHHLEYARLLAAVHRNPDARRELQMAVGLPPTSSALDARYQAEAKELLAKYK